MRVETRHTHNFHAVLKKWAAVEMSKFIIIIFSCAYKKKEPGIILKLSREHLQSLF